MEKAEFSRDEFFQELQRIRESKGLGLEDMSRRCKIRQFFLEAIESGSFENLPEPVYAKIFIKTYADLLEVDAGPILAKYAKHVERTIPAPQPEAQEARAREPGIDKAVFDWLGSKGRQLGWAVLALAVIVVLGIYVIQDKSETPFPQKTTAREAAKPPEKPPEAPSEASPAPPVQQPEAVPQQQVPVQESAPQQAPAQAAVPEPVKPETPLPAEKKETAPQAPPAAGALSLTVEATEAAWVQVKADKTQAVQRLLMAGDKLSIEAKERITVDLGNAGGVQITFQGQSLGSPGKRGEVMHLVYPEGKRVERKKPEESKPAAEPVTKPAAE